MLHPDVCGGSHEGLLAVHSLSKRSNLAGYRAGFVTGDPALVHELLGVRKHAGMLVPGPGAGRDGRRRWTTTSTSPSSGRVTAPGGSGCSPPSAARASR